MISVYASLKMMNGKAQKNQKTKLKISLLLKMSTYLCKSWHFRIPDTWEEPIRSAFKCTKFILKEIPAELRRNFSDNTPPRQLKNI
jgi:hypothetical protein